MQAWTWNTNRARKSRLKAAWGRLMQFQKAPGLLQECANLASLRQRELLPYPNVTGTAGVLWQTRQARDISAVFGDESVQVLLLRSGLALLSIYLPDSGKTLATFEEALRRVHGAVTVVRDRGGTELLPCG